MKPIATRDFERIHGLSELKVSPDGKHAAYCVTCADVDADCYKTRLYLLDLESGKSRPLTQEDGKGYAFAPDGAAVLFPALRSPDDKEAVQRGEELTVFYRLSLEGGEASECFRIEACVKTLESLGEGRWLVSHLCDLTRPDLSGLRGEKRAQALERWKKDADQFHVIDELPFWGDGRGFVNKKRTRLSIFHEKTGALLPVTHPNMDVGAFALSEDKKTVVFAGNDVKDWKMNYQGLYRVNLCDGETETLIPGAHEFGEIALLGERIVTAGSIHGDGIDLRGAKLFTYDDGKKALEQALPFDEEMGVSLSFEASMGGDAFRAAGDEIVFISTREYVSRLRAWRPGEKELRTLSPDGWNILSFAPAGRRMLAVAFSREGGFQEIVSIQDGEVRPLTRLGRGLFQGAPKAEPLSFVNRDGVRVDGWVLKPLDYDPGKKYPAILSVHGGPRWAYCEAFNHEMQVFSSRGYFVFYCNPRGSSTRGDAFAELSDKWGSIDFDDVMAFTDEVLRAYPAIDDKRLGITGGSYGGFMTNWAIGHTDRFAAAATCRSITYWPGFYGVSDLGGWYDKHEQGGTLWENEQKLRDHSPLFALDRVKTPTLIIHSFEDYRCPAPEAYALYQALIEHGVETRMVLFKGESHGLSRNGKPSHRVRRLEEIAGWFDSHLK